MARCEAKVKGFDGRCSYPAHESVPVERRDDPIGVCTQHRQKIERRGGLLLFDGSCIAHQLDGRYHWFAAEGGGQ